MSSKARGLKSAIDAFIERRGIEAGMDQNLMKEAIHLHLLSALSEAGVLQHVIFQGGTALHICYGGRRVHGLQLPTYLLKNIAGRSCVFYDVFPYFRCRNARSNGNANSGRAGVCAIL
jgi:hypothetical protein